MKTARPLALLIAAGLLVAGIAPAPAAPRKKPQSANANAHLSAIALIQRWAQATYRFLPVANPGPPVSDSGFPNEPDKNGNFIRTIIEPDGTRTVITNHGGSAFDFDIDIDYSNGLKEHVEARPDGEELLNGVPTGVRFVHTFSTGDRVEYVQELQQDPTFDFGLNFLYGVIWRGEVELRSGDCLRFELRQTKSFDCFNFFTGFPIPEEECMEWFDLVEIEPGFFAEVPKPDRLHVDLDCGAQQGTLDLTFPLLEPDVLDFGRNATGKYASGRQELDIALVPGPEPPGWSIWETRGPGFEGAFQLNNDFSGKGTAFRVSGGGGLSAKGKKRKLEFSARWSKQGIGTIVLPGGQVAPAGPFAGALDFQSMKWSGLGARFGPAPGL